MDKNFFLKQYQEKFPDVQIPTELSAYFQELASNAKTDFTTNVHGYFSHEDFQKILLEAAVRLNEKLKNQSLNFSVVSSAWNGVVTDFHTNQYWGVQPDAAKPAKKPLTEIQLRRREVFSYIWMAMQALVLMKIVILYFALHMDYGFEYKVLFVIACILSYGSLMFFGWRKHKKQKKEE